MKTGHETPDPGLAGDRARVSVLVTTGNEEESIGGCLESVRWADEIVVIDSCSTDRTVEIARGYTERILIEPWRGYIGQKEYALKQATHPWVLFVDADERVTPELRREILEELARQPVRWAGFEMRRKVRYLGRWILHGDWYPDHKLRLFLREKGQVGGEEPHDRVIVDGPVKRLRGELLHFTYRDLKEHLETVNRFSTISAERMVRAGRRCGVVPMLAHPVARFVRSYVLRGGFLDGIPGLVGAVIVAFGVFVKYAKVRELRMTSAASGKGEDPGAVRS